MGCITMGRWTTRHVAGYSQSGFRWRGDVRVWELVPGISLEPTLKESGRVFTRAHQPSFLVVWKEGLKFKGTSVVCWGTRTSGQASGHPWSAVLTDKSKQEQVVKPVDIRGLQCWRRDGQEQVVKPAGVGVLLLKPEFLKVIISVYIMQYCLWNCFCEFIWSKYCSERNLRV